MGGVSYHRLVAAVSEAGGIGTLGASTMRRRRTAAGDGQGPRADRQAVRRRPADRDAGSGRAGHPERDRRRGAASSSPASACHARSSTCCTPTTSSSAACAARSATRSARSPAASTSSSPRAPRPAATPAPSRRWRWCRRWSTRSATRCPSSPPAVCSTGAGWPRRWRSAPTACGSARASSPRPRRARCNGYKEALLATAEDGTVISRSYTGKTCRVVRNEWTNHFEQHPGGTAAVPAAGDRLGEGGRQPPRRTRRHRGRRVQGVHAVRTRGRRHRPAGAGRRPRAARWSPRPSAPSTG